MTLDSVPRFRPVAALLTAALCAVAVAGCLRRHTVDCTDTGAPKYDRLEVVYELREGRGVLGSNAIQPVTFVMTEDGGSQLAEEQRWASAELTIEFPHAEARDGYARATLRLFPTEETAHPSVASTIVAPADAVVVAAPLPEATDDSAPQHETWVLDLPREQIDLLIVDVARSGFFENQSRPVGGARLAVRLDEGQESKAWDPDPRLDDLAERVYSQGWIQGFAKPQPPVRPWWSFR